MSVLNSMPYHHAVSRVSRWCSWYTREVDDQVAGGRRDELASDLYEHAVWADEMGTTPRAAARAILSRALRGAPADLSWRRAQRRRLALAEPAAYRARRLEGVAASLVLLVASAQLAWGVFVLSRIAISTVAGDIRPGSATAITVALFTVISGAGVVLLARPRTRFWGSLGMAISSFGLVHFGLYQLYSLSATVGALTYSMPAWDLASTGVIAGLTLFFAAAAIWWWPARRSVPSGDSVGRAILGKQES